MQTGRLNPKKGLSRRVDIRGDAAHRSSVPVVIPERVEFLSARGYTAESAEIQSCPIRVPDLSDLTVKQTIGLSSS